VFPRKALSSLNIKRNRLCFGCPSSYLLEPPGHQPPAFLFLSSTMSNSGEAFVKLPIHAADENSTGSPLGSHRRFSQPHIEFT